MIACVAQYIMLVVIHSPYHSAAWLAMPLAGVIHIFFAIKDRKKEEQVKTFVGEASGAVWMAIGLSYFVLSFVFNKIGWQYSFPFYILLYGLGTFITGRLIKFKPLVYGGFVCLLLVVITPYLTYDNQILTAAFAILISYIVPGHLLRNHYRTSKQTTA